MVVLNHITSAIDRTQRVKLNENWEIIREAFVNIQRQINILAGEEVDELLARIAKAIESSETSVGEINQLIIDVEQKLLEVAQATTTANESAQNADNKASLAVTAITNANDARDGALQAIADTRVILEDFTTRMTTALTNVEAATTSANNATTETLAAKVKAEEALVEAGESKSLTDQAVIDANDAVTKANQASEKANQAADNIAGYDLPIVDFVIGDTYIKHQAVRDNGSTYRAKVETTGNPLPVSPNTETDFWTLEAKAGRDGKGTVQSVNNELPDEEGNVTIVFPPTDWEDVPNKPTEFTPTVHTQPMETIEELDATLQAINDSIALIGQTGIPKLVSYPFVVDIVEDQVTYKIPLVSFDKSNDTLFVFKNTIVLYEQEHYTVNSQNEVVLKDPPLSGKMLFVILKNVPIGPSGSVSGSVIADNTITKNKLEQSIQDILDNSNRELAVGEATEVSLIRDFNVLNVATKSLAEVKRIDGRTIVNLASLFDSGLWSFNHNVTIVSPNKITMNVTESFQASMLNIPIKNTNNTYTLSLTYNGRIDVQGWTTSAFVERYYQDDTSTNTHGDKEITFTINNPSVQILKITLTNIGSGVFTFENISLVEGSQAQPFVSNVKGITNPTIVNETNGTSMVIPTTLYDGEYLEHTTDGKLIKHKKWQELILDDKLTYEHFMNRTGFKEIRITNVMVDAKKPTLEAPYQPQDVIKYDGSVLLDADTYSNTGVQLSKRGDVSYFDHLSKPNTLLITIWNADSGWGPDYIPTPAEIKAHILGWKMANTSVSWAELYNGTGVKGWASRNDSFKGEYVSSALSGGTDVLPTLMAPINSKWKPNKIIYELAIPVKEDIRPVGNLILDVGENNLTLKEGRIVGEKTNPFFEAGTVPLGDVYNVNNQYNIPSLLKYKADEIFTVYKNSAVESGIVRYGNTTTTAGAMFQILASQYDPTAVYTTNYDPLYVWQVSAPISGADIEYRSSLGSVVEDLVDEVSSNSNDIVQLQNTSVFKGEKAKEYKITMVGISDGYIRVLKDSLGTVELTVVINSGKWLQGMLVGKLPPNLVPKNTVAIFGMLANYAPYTTQGLFYVATDGSIMTALGTTIAEGTILSNAAIQANVIYKSWLGGL